MLSLQNITFKNQQSITDCKKIHQRIRWRKEKNSNPPIFITKTYQILQNHTYHNIISWNEQGINFSIHNVEKFEQEVLPVHFRHKNFSSFVRQLNMYDFHKIRNDNNISIFEHKEFKRNHKEILKNIKRKGCNGKKIQQNEKKMTISDNEELQFDNQQTPQNEQKYNHEEKYQKTIESIEKSSHEISMNSFNSIRYVINPSPHKKQKMEEFMNSLPEIIQTEGQIRNKIKQLKNDPQYQCLNTKKDIRKLISKIKKKLPKSYHLDDLEGLSIEEEIMADKIDQDFQDINIDPSLTILATQKFLPRSVNLLDSINFYQDLELLFFKKMY